MNNYDKWDLNDSFARLAEADKLLEIRSCYAEFQAESDRRQAVQFCKSLAGALAVSLLGYALIWMVLTQ